MQSHVNEFQRLAPFQLGHSVKLNWWTWHDLNVRPRPSQSRALIPLSYRSNPKDECGRMKDETEWCGSSVASSFIPHPSSFDMAEGTGVEPASDRRAVVFGTTALPVRLPFREDELSAWCLVLCFHDSTMRGEKSKYQAQSTKIRNSLCNTRSISQIQFCYAKK